MTFTFADSYGYRGGDLDAAVPVELDAVEFVFDSPVGTTRDERGNWWVADTGHNRLVVLDRGVETVLAVVDAVDATPARLDLPFRLAHHPDARTVYLTDIGNGRVLALDYAFRDGRPVVERARPLARPSGPFHPNGVAVHAYPDGVRVFVSDEFYHEGDDLRGRVVVFDADGDVVDTFRSVTWDDGEDVPLYWPQGVAVDDEGRVYVANTGYGVLYSDVAPVKYATVVRADRRGRAEPFAGRAGPTLGEIPQPRDVAVVGVDGADASVPWAAVDERAAGRILVPDAVSGRVYVFSGAGVAQGKLPGVDGDDPSPYARREEALPTHLEPEAARWRFGAPVSMTPPAAPKLPDDSGDDPTVAAFVTESLADTASTYALDVDRGTAERLASAGVARDGPGRLAFPVGTALLPDEGGPGTVVVTDARNGRLQRAPVGGSLAPVDLSENRFPFGLAVLGGESPRLFVSDYTVAARERERPQVHVYAPGDDGFASGSLDHVAAFAPWGVGRGEAKLPRGMAVEPLDGGRARVYVADSGNGRVGVWTYDGDVVSFDRDVGTFGHYEGGLWNPSDVAVGEGGVYVADENNNRLQRYADGDWTVLGEAGYAPDEFLLPISVAAHDGFLFVVDLVSRGLAVFVDDGGLRLVDAVSEFGGHPEDGELWLPYLVSVADADGEGASLLVADASLNVAHRYTWRP